MLQIAKILKSNGIDGGILIEMRDIETEDINLREPVFIEFDGIPVPFLIADIRSKGLNKAIIHLNDVTSLADAEEIVGRAIYADIESEEEQEEDFTGWKLLNRGQDVGTVTGMEFIPGNPCLYIGDIMIPFHPDLVMDVDEEGKTINLDLPEGLL